MLAPLNIVFEDEAILVFDKPGGLMVEPDRNNFPNLLNQVKTYLKETTGEKLPYVQHLHRLDRVTSGLVLFTKRKDCLKNLSEQFAERKVLKFYTALTNKAPNELTGVLEHWHRKEKKKAVLVSEGTEYAERVKLDYVAEPFDNNFIWHIKLHTGKYHQIRVQLSSIGCPIIGDEMYGSTISYKPNEIALHASKLIVTHPVTNQLLTFESPAHFSEY